ncbi:MAG: Hint domain-containing protein [Pseudomonadota bacterium]
MATLHSLRAYRGRDFDGVPNGGSLPTTLGSSVSLDNTGGRDFIVSDTGSAFSGVVDVDINNNARTAEITATYVLETDPPGGADVTLYEITLNSAINGSTLIYVFDGPGPATSDNFTISSYTLGAASPDYEDLDSDVEGVTGNDFPSNDNTGDDTVFGYDGNDTIRAGNGEDTVFGGDGNDNIRGQGQADTIHGDAGNDVVDGDGGADTLFGGTGSDTLTGDGGNDTLYGSDASTDDGEQDTLTGGNGFDEFVILDGSNDIITDFGQGSDSITDGNSANNDRVTLSSFYDTLEALRDDFSDNGILDNPDNGALNLTISGITRDDLTTDTTGVVCFTTGTLITTPRGPVLVEALRPGDIVSTLDNGLQPVRWVGKRSLSALRLKLYPHLRPILVRANAFGDGRPVRDMRVSPQHRLLVKAAEAQAMFGTNEVLVPACHLVDGVRILYDTAPMGVTYVHFLCEEHQIVDADGCLSETFHPGPVGLSTLDDAALQKMAELFPEIEDGHVPFPLARKELKKREAHLLRSTRDVTVRPMVYRQKSVQHHRAQKR